MQWRRIFGIATVVFVLAIITAYVFVITQNITVESSIGFLNWNPPPRKNSIPFYLNYPDVPGLEINVPGGLQMMGASILINFVMSYNGTLTENTPIQIEDATCIFMIENKITNIEVIYAGFPQAMPTSYKPGNLRIGGPAGVAFPTGSQPIMDTIYFPVAGDYSPMIWITFSNGTQPIYYTYNEYKVHVIAASEAEALNINRLNLALTFALLGFSYIEGIMVIHKLWSKPKEPNREETHKPSATRGKNLDKEERKLQIKIAQLNAGLQTYLAVIFGATAAAVALLVFGYQIAFESYPQITFKTVIAMAFWAVAFYIAYFAYRTVPKLKACLKEIKELK